MSAPKERIHMGSLLVIALAALGLVAWSGSAQAQLGPQTGPSYGPGYRGNISPYLNLQRGRNTGIDYYLGTRSEFQRRQNAAEFRQDIDDLSQRESVAVPPEKRRARPVATGTQTSFGSLGEFYPNRQRYISPSVGRVNL